MDFSLTSVVEGARVGFYGGNEWNYGLLHLAHFGDAVDGVQVAAQNGDEATVVVTSHRMETVYHGAQPETKERRDDSQTLHLRLDHSNIPVFGKDTWRIVPPPIDDVLAKPLDQTPSLLLAAAVATHDPRLGVLLRQERAESQLKQLALGVLQFVQDYDETFAFDDAGHERALRPYLKDDTLYTIIGTTGEKWHFNDHLAGVSQAKLNDVSHTVLFYDGTAPQSDALNFRFDGKTVIGFVDGHAAARSKDETKDLIWAP